MRSYHSQTSVTIRTLLIVTDILLQWAAHESTLRTYESNAHIKSTFIEGHSIRSPGDAILMYQVRRTSRHAIVELPRLVSLLFLMLFYRALVYVELHVKVRAQVRWVDYKLDIHSACMWLHSNREGRTQQRDKNWNSWNNGDVIIRQFPLNWR